MASMTTLNKAAAGIMVRHHASAATDVTGFGLIGHLRQIAVESKVTAEIWADSLPVLPGVPDYAAGGIFSGANERNADYSQSITTFDADVAEAARAICFDAQTSGGLLMAVPAAVADAALGDLHAAGIASAAVIGRIVEPSEGRIRVRRAAEDKNLSAVLEGTATGAGLTSGRCARGEVTPAPEEATSMRGPPCRHSQSQENPMKTTEPAGQDVCCSHVPGGGGDALKRFSDFLGSAMAPGALDVVTKEHIAIALGLAVHCVPCTRMHLKKAKNMGITAQELEEVAALAIAFGGCRALMLWNELKKELF
jgi:AhpD family alkylhydroperoxidase